MKRASFVSKCFELGKIQVEGESKFQKLLSILKHKRELNDAYQSVFTSGVLQTGLVKLNIPLDVDGGQPIIDVRNCADCKYSKMFGTDRKQCLMFKSQEPEIVIK